jgi:hypothetical protein
MSAVFASPLQIRIADAISAARQGMPLDCAAERFSVSVHALRARMDAANAFDRDLWANLGGGISDAAQNDSGQAGGPARSAPQQEARR